VGASFFIGLFKCIILFIEGGKSMAYNVVKGNVEGSVDQHADQEIDGVKIFKNTVSASVFYDTDAQSPCATINNVAIENLITSNKAGIITYEGDKKARAHRNLVFDGKNFKTDNAVFNTITGSAVGLFNIPADQLLGKVPGESINVGLGLEASKTYLKIKKHHGIKLSEDGLTLDLATNGGIDFSKGKIQVDPRNALDVSAGGQNVSDADTILLYDSSRNEIRYTTFKNLYDNYVNLKVPHAAGNTNSIQIKGRKGFEGNESLTFDSSSSTLVVKGRTKTLEIETSQQLKSNGETHLNGSVFQTIKTVSSKNYDIQDTDNTILLDTTNNSVEVTLPKAKESYGRVLIIKKIVDEDQKYKIRGNNTVRITTSGELIDFTTEITLKSNYSSRTLHSDGVKWWITNANGS